MTFRLAAATASAKAAAATGLLDVGAAAGTISVYTGAQPADADAAPTGTLLMTVTLADPAFTDPVNGSALLAGTPLSGTPSTTGTAGWFRAADSDGTPVFDGTVGTSAAELILSTVDLEAGVSMTIQSGTYTQSPS